MLAARMTLPLFVSSAISFSKSAGEVGSTMFPSSANRAFILGLAMAALISLFSLSTISVGVFLGARYHAKESLRSRREFDHGRHVRRASTVSRSLRRKAEAS